MTNWVISGQLDTDTRSITYDGCSKTNFVYDNSGEVVSDDSEYEDIPGVITFNDDGSFTWHRDLPEGGEDMVFEWVGMQQDLFSYEHDPRENPEAMKDIVENADAVYGFSPNPESTRLGVYAEYDWTDPEFVAEAQEERRAYHESMSTMMDILYEMRAEGASIEEMARAVSTERNRLRLEAYKDDPEGLEKLKQSNLDTYGHEDGPTPDELYEKYGRWRKILRRSRKRADRGKQHLRIGLFVLKRPTLSYLDLKSQENAFFFRPSPQLTFLWSNIFTTFLLKNADLYVLICTYLKPKKA